MNGGPVNQNKVYEDRIKEGPQYTPSSQPSVVVNVEVNKTRRNPVAYLLGMLLILACCIATFLAFGGAELLKNFSQQ